MSTWHYIAIGMLILNTGIVIGSFKVYINDLKHIHTALKRIEDKQDANDKRLDEHAKSIAVLEERTTK